MRFEAVMIFSATEGGQTGYEIIDTDVDEAVATFTSPEDGTPDEVEAKADAEANRLNAQTLSL